MPSIQFSLNLGVIHPHPNAINHIGSVVLEIQDLSQPLTMEYDIRAEDMPTIIGKISFSKNDLEKLIDEIAKGKEITFKTQETIESL
jgi:hypothetical protein